MGNEEKLQEGTICKKLLNRGHKQFLIPKNTLRETRHLRSFIFFCDIMGVPGYDYNLRKENIWQKK